MANKILEAYMGGVSQRRQTEQQAKDEEFRQKQFKLAQDEFKANHEELLRQHDIENARADSIAAFNKSVAELKQQEEIQAHYAQYGVEPPGSTVEKPTFSQPRAEESGAVNAPIPTDLSGILAGHARITDPKGKTLDALTPEANAQLQAKLLDITQGPLIERQFKKEQQIQEGQANIEKLKIESERVKERNAHAARMEEIDRQNVGRLNAARARGTSSQTQTKALAISSKFDALPAVRRYDEIRSSSMFAESLDDNTTNGSDDQALIYVFGKAEDPLGTVREGEAEVIRKYTQTFKDKFKLNLQRVMDGTESLTPEARREIKTTIAAKATSAEKEYLLMRKETEKQFRNIKEDPEDWLKNYGNIKGETTPSLPNDIHFDKDGKVIKGKN